MVITINASSEIFNSPNVKRQVEKIFEEAEAVFQNRLNEIKNFIDSKNGHEDYDEITEENVLLKFKNAFFEKIAGIAVENAFSTDNHDLESNLVAVLSKENLENAIAGETMIEAVSGVITEIATDDAFSAALHGSTIFLINKHFLEVDPFVKQEGTNNTENAHATVIREYAEEILPWITEDIDD